MLLNIAQSCSLLWLMDIFNRPQPLLTKFASPLPRQQRQANICAVEKVAQLQPMEAVCRANIQYWAGSLKHRESKITWSWQRNITPLPFPAVPGVCVCVGVRSQEGGRVRRWRSSGAVAMVIKYLRFSCRMVASSLEDGDFKACNWVKAFSEEQWTSNKKRPRKILASCRWGQASC